MTPVMRYQFRHPVFGLCHVATKLSGKHGFALPKLFLVRIDQRPDLGTFSYRFDDRALRSVEDGRNEDALRMRVAIAQFLQCDLSEAVSVLDLSIPAYQGEVCNALGHPLYRDSFHTIRAKVASAGL
jgi:hypothetical protein